MPDLKHWSARELEKLRKDVDHMFDEFCQEMGLPPVGRKSEELTLAEEGDKLVFTAHLPGYDPKDIELMVMDTGLILRGKRRQATGVSIATETLERRLSFPCRVMTRAAKATFQNEVLIVELPRCEACACRKITFDS